MLKKKGKRKKMIIKLPWQWVCSISQAKPIVVHKYTVARTWTDVDILRPYVFNKIMHDVCNYDAYFVQKYDTTGVLGLLSKQKLTTSLRMLSFGASAD
ncbi:unnamed protein product [Prunus armeniaca]